RLIGGHANQGLHFFAGKRPATPRRVVVLLHDLHGVLHGVMLAFNRQLGIAQVRAHVQHVLQQTHVLVQRAKEGFNLSGNVYGTSHPCGGLSNRYRVADGIPPYSTANGAQRRFAPCNSSLLSLQEETSNTLAHAPPSVKLRRCYTASAPGDQSPSRNWINSARVNPASLKKDMTVPFGKSRLCIGTTARFFVAGC